MNSKLHEFLVNNEIRAGKDFSITPPMYYRSLDLAFHSFFKTFRVNHDTYHFLTNFSIWNRESIATNFSMGTEHTIHCIFGFHRFFELFQKDLLKRIDPLLATKAFHSAREIIKHSQRTLNPEEIQTIEYQETRKRLREVFKLSSKKDSPVKLALIKNYQFLFAPNCNEGLKELTWMRNRLMHNGTTLINVYGLDYLVTQHLVPVITKILLAEADLLGQYKLRFTVNSVEINILERLNQIRYNVTDFNDQSKHKALQLKILEIAHLKELGRACYENPMWPKMNQAYHEPYYDDPIGRYERFAESENKHPDFITIQKCPCCGVKSVVVYKHKLEPKIFESEPDFISWLKCYCCGYHIKDNIGDPYYFKIFKSNVFPEA